MSGDLQGRRLGKYEIRAEIGRGGMGTVYLAHDPLLERRVAVKVLAPHLVGQPGLIERFLREARAAARLKHPNIVTIYDVGQDGDVYYFVMEYVDGPSLAAALRQRGPLDPTAVVSLVRSLASALDYAHAQGLVHRDVKPGNILLGPGGAPALGDFGIARAAEDARLTATGTLVGTPEYMSPEQARGDEVDYRTDLYSLAIVAYELLGGRSPFAGGTPHGVLYRHVHEPPPPLRSRPAGQPWPPAVDAVLHKALAKEPGARYETAGAFADALAVALRGAEPAARGQAPTARGEAPTALVAGSRRPPVADQATAAASRPARRPPPPPSAAGRRAPSRLWLLLALLVVLGGGALVVALLGGEGERVAAPAAPVTPAVVTTPPTATGEPPAIATPAAPGEFVCNDPAGCVDLAPGQPVHLGYLLVIAGSDAALGVDSWRGAELAVAGRGEIRGHPIELTGQDGGCSAQGGLLAANELARDPTLVAVVGPSCSSEAHEAIPVLCAAGIPLVSPSNTAPELTGPDRPDEYWCYLRTAHNDLVQGLAAARFAREALGLSRAATIHDDGNYSRALAEIFAREFESLGGTITGGEVMASGAMEPRPLLAALARTEPQLLYYPVFFEVGVPLTREARGIEALAGVALLGSDGLFSPEFLQAAGEAARGFLWTGPDLAAYGPAYSELVALYREQYGEPPIGPYHAHAFDAANMIMAAVDAVAVDGPGGSLHIPRRALVEALFATREFPGIIGRLTCRPNGDCAEAHIAVYEAVDVDPGRWDPGQGEGHNPTKIWP